MVSDIDPKIFLPEYWQKNALFLTEVFPCALPAVDPDELAWLATLPDVESRLVLTEKSSGAVRYRLESGPFEEARLRDLPDQNWTLLVQDVEKHLPDFRRYFGKVAFIPDWRIDDLMVSCAAPGGSVGPHVDNYDVFLVQGAGARHWKIGRPEEVEPDVRTEGLSLVMPFAATAEYLASAGDVLYLPPGVPHWGIAEDLCVTLSIGCRAPTRRELQLGQERVLGKPVTADPDEHDQVFYRDPDLVSDEAAPGKIDSRTLTRVREQRLLDAGLTDIELARVFGSVMTDPKAWLDPDPLALDAVQARLHSAGTIEVHGMARIAWCVDGDNHLVFVNGADRQVPSDVIDVFRSLCRERQLRPADANALRATEDGSDSLAWMAAKGMFDAGHDDE